MSQQSELLKTIDTLPPKYLGEVIDFAGYLQHKAELETNANSANKAMGKDAKSSNEKLNLTKKELDEMLRTAKTPISDSLTGILSHLGDITIEQIREERLAKYLTTHC